MTVNKKLLPIKAQYFVFNAGSAPLLPFIPIIVKELGFSSIALGWIFTAYPILTIFLKPLSGSMADKFKSQKTFLLIILIIHLVASYSVKWVPSLPFNNYVTLNCDEELVVTACSDKLEDTCFSNNILKAFNSTNICKISLEDSNNNLALHNAQQGLLNDMLVISDHIDHFPVQLDHGNIEGKCLSIYFKNGSALSSKWSEICASSKAELSCENSFLKELIMKPSIEESKVTLSYQFWILFSILISVRVSGTIAVSFLDTICFEYLGDKPENYGKQRMWGAIGWGIFSIIAGLSIDYVSKGKDKKDYSVSFYMMLFFFIVQILIIALLKVNQKTKSKSIMKDVRNLFKNIKICIFIAWCIISGIYVSFVWNFLFWFIEDLASKNGCVDKSYLKTLQGLVLTVHTYCGEIPFFFLSGRILKKIGHINAMTLVLFTFGIRFLIYSSLVNPWWILPVECLNGITFGLFYSTMTTYASKIAPSGTENTVQTLVAAIFEGFGTSLGGLLGGYLFQALGSSQTFFLLGSSAIAFAFVHIIAQTLSKDVKPEFYKAVAMKKPDDEKEEDKGIVF